MTTPEIALELLGRVRPEGLPGRAVVTDAGYDVSGPFREGLEERGRTYMVGVNGDFVVFTEQPTWDRPTGGPSGPGRPRTRPRLAPNSPEPVTLGVLAARIRRHRVGWREGTKGMRSGHFAWGRVWPAHGWKTGDCADAAPLRVLIEKPGDDSPLKFAFSNLPAGTSRVSAVRLWKSRWPVEVDLRNVKVTLGMDVLRCKTPALVRKEVWAHLLADNLIRTAMAQVAVASDRQPREVSVAGTVQGLAAFATVLDTDAGYQAFVRVVLAYPVGDRPDWFEPRARKRRPKSYPPLTAPRDQARKRLARST